VPILLDPLILIINERIIMVAFLLISAFITPPFAFLLLYCNLIAQDGKTKEEVQTEVRAKLIRYPLFWIWLIYAILMISWVVIAYK